MGKKFVTLFDGYAARLSLLGSMPFHLPARQPALPRADRWVGKSDGRGGGGQGFV